MTRLARPGEAETMAAEIEMSAAGPPPRDGSEIEIELRGWVPAYWDDELKTFVLSRSLHMESIREPGKWRPRKPVRVIT